MNVAPLNNKEKNLISNNLIVPMNQINNLATTQPERALQLMITFENLFSKLPNKLICHDNFRGKQYDLLSPSKVQNLWLNAKDAHYLIILKTPQLFSKVSNQQLIALGQRANFTVYSFIALIRKSLIEKSQPDVFAEEFNYSALEDFEDYSSAYIILSKLKNCSVLPVSEIIALVGNNIEIAKLVIIYTISHPLCLDIWKNIAPKFNYNTEQERNFRNTLVNLWQKVIESSPLTSDELAESQKKLEELKNGGLIQFNAVDSSKPLNTNREPVDIEQPPLNWVPPAVVGHFPIYFLNGLWTNIQAPISLLACYSKSCGCGCLAPAAVTKVGALSLLSGTALATSAASSGFLLYKGYHYFYGSSAKRAKSPESQVTHENIRANVPHQLN